MKNPFCVVANPEPAPTPEFRIATPLRLIHSYWYPHNVLRGKYSMAKVTLVFALLLVVLGLAGFLGTGSIHPTALIPTWFGLALGLFGFLAISPSEGRRKLFMHINVTIALLGFLGAAGRAVYGYAHASAAGTSPDAIALGSQAAMAGLMLIYVILCVRSFIVARRSGKV
jgi:hypothetical protein